MIREDDSRRRRRLRRLDVEWNSDGWNMFVFFSFSLLFVLTCLHEWRVLERSGARAHLRGRTTCPSVVVVVVVVERARSLSPSHSLSLSLSLSRNYPPCHESWTTVEVLSADTVRVPLWTSLGIQHSL